jgi:hypothetical protein
LGKSAIITVNIGTDNEEVSNPRVKFGEGNTYVSVDDEAGGPFLTIQQHDDSNEPGKVRMDYEEFMAVAEAAKMLMHQMYIEKAEQDTK